MSIIWLPTCGVLGWEILPHPIPPFDISELCHEYAEPVFITKNGTGYLAVMSIETYELLAGKLEYSLVNEGLEQAKSGKTKTMKGFLKNIRGKIH